MQTESSVEPLNVLSASAQHLCCLHLFACSLFVTWNSPKVLGTPSNQALKPASFMFPDYKRPQQNFEESPPRKRIRKQQIGGCGMGRSLEVRVSLPRAQFLASVSPPPISLHMPCDLCPSSFQERRIRGPSWARRRLDLCVSGPTIGHNKPSGPKGLTAPHRDTASPSGSSMCP